jgi:hypothetical protein
VQLVDSEHFAIDICVLLSYTVLVAEKIRGHHRPAPENRWPFLLRGNDGNMTAKQTIETIRQLLAADKPKGCQHVDLLVMIWLLVQQYENGGDAVTLNIGKG